MSDYSQSIDFSAKDALTTGDPAKLIKGADIDTELNLISTAIASKSGDAENNTISGNWNFTGSPTFTNLTPVVQIVGNQTGASSTGTTTMPEDDTIPQNTEGDEYLTQAITPKNTNNTLVIDVNIYGGHSGNGRVCVALFQDSTADALASAIMQLGSGTTVHNISLSHKMTAGTTSATTFKVRVGAPSAGTFTLNGASGSRVHGGVLASGIRIIEYQE